MEMSSGEDSSAFYPLSIDDFNLWFLRHYPKVSLKASNDHAVRLSHNLKNRRHGILKARSPYAPFEGHIGEEFKPVWEDGRMAFFNTSNRCFLSATRDGQLFSDCNTSSPGPHELFDVESRNQLVALRSAHGTYVGLESGGEKLVCSATTVGSNELFQLRIKAYIQDNNGNYIAAERNNSLVTQRFRPGPARGDCFIVELGSSHCSFRSQFNRYWVAESNGNISAATPANSNRKSTREEFVLEGYRNDHFEPDRVYFAIRTTHGAFIVSDADKIVTVSREAITKNVEISSRSGGCFSDHLFDILYQPTISSTCAGPSFLSTSSSSAELQRTPSFIAWAKNSLPSHGLTGSGPAATTKRDGDCLNSPKDGSPEESLRNRLGARLRQHVERKAGRRRRLRTGADTDDHKVIKEKGCQIAQSENSSKNQNGSESPNVFPHRSKSMNDQLDRSGRDRLDDTAPRSDPVLKRSDTFDFPSKENGKRSSGIAKSAGTLGNHDQKDRTDAIRKQGGSCGSPLIERVVNRNALEDREDSFERIDVNYIEGDEDIEDGWWEISNSENGDYEYHTGEMPLSTRPSHGSQKKRIEKDKSLSPSKATQSKKGMDDEMAEWKIDSRDLQLSDRVLGKGFFGEVKRGRWRGTPVAVKIIYREVFRSRSEEQLFDKEVSMLRSLHHPHVIQFLGVCHFKDKRQRCIVTEFMKKGSLHDLLHNEPALFKDKTLHISIARDIAKGMCYLHMSDPPTLHRDLSSKNVLIDRFLRAKIADFGLSRLKEESGVFTQGCGALAFMAPEVYRGESYSEKADVYSYAIILWEMWNMGRYPHEVAWMDQLAYAAECALRDYRPHMMDDIPEPWRQLIALCWHKNPSARPSFSQILNILKQIERISKGGQSGVDYLDLGDYMAESLLLEESSSAHTIVSKSTVPYHRNQKSDDDTKLRGKEKRTNNEDEVPARSGNHKYRNQGKGEESEEEEEGESGYWSERKVEQRLKKAELHTITPRAAKPPVGRGSEGRSVNYVDQDLRPPLQNDPSLSTAGSPDDEAELEETVHSPRLEYSNPEVRDAEYEDLDLLVLRR